MLEIKYDLGLRYLAGEWKKMISPRYLKEDIIAGITVACIALPLSLAIALASNVPPAAGLITAIVAGIVCAIFGGTTLAVSGPTAAMSVLIASNVDQFGLGGFLIIGLICGVLQLLSGIFGAGTIMKFVPVPVVGGFTAGIGAIILVGQLPRAFNLPAPDQSHVLDVLLHIGNLFQAINIEALLLALTSFIIIHFLPKVTNKLPSPLVAIAIPTILLFLFPSPTINVIGDIPRSLPVPTFPTLPKENLSVLFFAAISVYFLSSLETLLSSSAVDKMFKVQKHDANQELIGQGFGNIASALFGGIPVTGVIARTVLNINAGAKTRRSAIIHAFILIACIFVLGSIIKYIPIPALAGVLISVAIRMLDMKAFFSLFQVSKSDAYVFIITFVCIIFSDLLFGVQAGLISAAIIAFIKISKPNILVDNSHPAAHQTIRCSIEGPLTFIATAKIEKISERLEQIPLNHAVVIDVTQLTEMDVTGASMLCNMLNSLKLKNISVILKGMSANHLKILRETCADKTLPFLLADDEPDVLKHTYNFDLKSVAARLLHGTELFKLHLKYREKNLFAQLANKQNPHTLFIACSDSRVSPNLITSTEPGELFVIRNVGNVIPLYSKDRFNGESAALEFALKHLNIKTIIVCGHANCVAVQAANDKNLNSNFNHESALDKWLENVHVNKENIQMSTFNSIKAAQDNAFAQSQNLFSYPIVNEKFQQKELAVFTWFYDIGNCAVEIYSNKDKKFIPIHDFQNQIFNENFDSVILKPDQK